MEPTSPITGHRGAIRPFSDSAVPLGHDPPPVEGDPTPVEEDDDELAPASRPTGRRSALARGEPTLAAAAARGRGRRGVARSADGGLRTAGPECAGQADRGC